MKAIRSLGLAVLLVSVTVYSSAQRACSTADYQQRTLSTDPLAHIRFEAVERFTQHQIAQPQAALGRQQQGPVIRVPVVVHILYHRPEENISDATVIAQIAVLNKCFRRQNADTINTPARFRPFAADCEIEFVLATSDPRRRNTNGIIHKYTPISSWVDDDKMKFSTQMGDDAWDTKSYLNIWVCNLTSVAGYGTMPGTAADKDGIVIATGVFGPGGSKAGYNGGKTAVHEIGHWLNLKHLWGDEYCGDDGVADTPKQSGYSAGCPSGIPLGCDKDPNGIMFMDYMDFTSDDCMNLFTLGQKERMRSLFADGGARASILQSTGLLPPLIYETPLPQEDPAWLHPQVYPNPATTQVTLDVAYDVRWIGSTLTLTNLQGQRVLQLVISSKQQVIDLSRLQPGMYLLTGKKEDGETIRQKIVKQ